MTAHADNRSSAASRGSAGGPAMINRFIRWTTLSSFGSGLVLPLTAVFLVGRTPLGTGGIAAFFAVAAITELGTSVLLTTVRVRLVPNLLAGGGYVVLATGYMSLGVVSGTAAVLALAVALGLGRGASSGGLPAYMRQMVGSDELRDLFARRYRALNFGLGSGLLAATLTLSLTSSSVLPYLFVATGLAFVPLALFLIRRRVAPARPLGIAPSDSSEGHAPHVDKLSLKQLIRVAGPICLVDLCVFTFAYSQLNTSAPLTATQLSEASLAFVSVMVAVNCLAVVVLQRPVTRLLNRWSPGRGMQVAAVSWLVGYLVACATSTVPGPVAWAGLILLAVLFAGGEAAYASSFQPWLFNAVPERESTRAASMANICSSVGLSAGPSFGVLLVATGYAPVVWGGLASACLLTLLYVTRLVTVEKRVQPPERVVDPAREDPR